MAFVVGLTGGVGSGKSTVADLFAGQGAEVIDTDQIAHQLTGIGQPAVHRIAKRFGAEVFTADGLLDRSRLRALVFSDTVARKDLEAILHPLIRREVIRRISASKAPYTVLVIPLLVETGSYELVNRVLVVDCSEERQIERVMRRNGLPREQVLAIMSAQASRQQRLARADDCVHNDQGIEMLPPQVQVLHRRYRGLAQGS